MIFKLIFDIHHDVIQLWLVNVIFKYQQSMHYVFFMFKNILII